MKTYRSQTTGLFVGRQADQLPDELYEVVEIPISKDELIEFINQLQPAEEKVHGEPSTEPTRVDWLRQWEIDTKERGRELELALELDAAIMRAPMLKCLRLAELIYGRLGDLAGKEKLT